MPNTTKATFTRYFKVHKTSPTPITAENISVQVQLQPKQSEVEEKLNSMALSILWAHFEACRQGLLDEDSLAPWEKIPKDAASQSLSPKETEWILFLKNIITDATWVEWLKDSKEARRRSIVAHRQLKED